NCDIFGFQVGINAAPTTNSRVLVTGTRVTANGTGVNLAANGPGVNLWASLGDVRTEGNSGHGIQIIGGAGMVAAIIDQTASILNGGNGMSISGTTNILVGRSQ